MACSTGEACGLTETRSGASRWANHSAVIRLTIDALDAWWPPTLTPERFSRTRLAWWTIAVASQSTRRWTASRVSGSAAARCGDGALVVGVVLKPADFPIPHRQDHVERHGARHSAGASRQAPMPGGHDPVAIGLHVVRLEFDLFPDAQPIPCGFAKRVFSLCGHVRLGPVLTRHDDHVFGVKLEHALEVAGVPALGRLADDVEGLLGHTRTKRTVHPSL